MNTREIIPFAEGQGLDLRLTLPGSKSITNRALLCAAMAKGESKITGALESVDTKVMRASLEKIGALKEGGDWNSETVTFELENAGTATRFLTAAMCVRQGETTLTGNEHMLKRPIGDLVDGLRQIGADITYLDKDGYLPLKINGKALEGGEITMRGDKSSQYFSAILMMAPLLQSPLTLKVDGELTSKPYMDITLSVMQAFGVQVENRDYKEFYVEPQDYQATDYEVEGDASSATYFWALQVLHGGKLEFENLNKNSVQGDANFIDKIESSKSEKIGMNEMPDAAMTLAVMAPFFGQKTTITGLSTLRIKETDRLAALENELNKVGAKASTTPDSLTIEPGGFHGAQIDTYDDHRMAMAFAVFGSRIPGIVVENPECTNKSYPSFWQDFERAYLAPVQLDSNHLVLTGMRGAGKSHYGRRIAKLLDRPFVDLDEEIEKETGKSIPEMVEKEGWKRFREIEQNICSKIYDKYDKPLVVATGGGVVLDENAMKNLKKNAVNIFIFADPAVLADRIKNSNRPSLTGTSSEAEVQKIWQERRHLYLKHADIIWDDTSGTVIEEGLEQIFTSF